MDQRLNVGVVKPGTPLYDVSTLHACKNGVRRLALTLNSIHGLAFLPLCRE